MENLAQVESINRGLFMSLSYESEVEPLNAITDINQSTKVIDESIARLCVQLSTQLTSATTKLVYDDYLDFKEMYAHSRCYVLFESLHYELGLYFDVNGVLLIDDNGDVAHYVVSFEYESLTFYIDAYGVYSSLEDIKKRYKGTVISRIDTLDPSDDGAPHYQQLNDRMIETYDLMAQFSDDIDIEVLYGEYFNKLLVEKLLAQILGANT